MPNPPATRRLALLAVLVLALAGCGSGQSPARQSGGPAAVSPIHCTGTDHSLYDPQMGWGFCYPWTWKYIEREQPTTQPTGVDTTFDVVVDAPSAQAGPDQGFFAFMIIGTYEQNGAASLAQWVPANLGSGWTLTPIQWGNATEAALATGPRTVRLAFTKHQVVELDLHSGQGNLNLEQAMSTRLATWRFDD